MELNEEQLSDILGGAPGDVAKESAVNDADLFRCKSIEELKHVKEEILRQQGELTENELDQVKAGIRM